MAVGVAVRVGVAVTGGKLKRGVVYVIVIVFT